MPNPLKKEDVEKFLAENIPYLQLVDWCGYATRKSLFLNTHHNRQFRSSFIDVKQIHKRGHYVGGPKSSEGQVIEYLQKHAPHIELLEWGGSVIAYSVFFDHEKNIQFERKFCKIKEGVNNGYRTTGHVKVTKKQAEKWLSENCPHVQLVKWGGSSTKISTFLDTKSQTYFYRRFSCARQNYVPPQNYEEECREWLSEHLPNVELAEWVSGNGAQSLFRSKDTNTYFYKNPGALRAAYREFGAERLKHLIDKPGYSSIEAAVKDLLEKHRLEYKHDKKVENSRENLRPDFILPDRKLIIECDGLFWHSDSYKKDHKYHYNKRLFYLENGYTPLFFRSDEVWDKTNIVESMILHRCGLIENKVFARKCSVVQDNFRWFLDENHLMGKGQGKCYGLQYEGEVVAVIQIRKRPNNGLEISRFCTKPKVLVVGGFSKLLKHIELIEDPLYVESFVDLRYGTGEHLKDLGFELANKPRVSFCWTNGRYKFHRMKYKKNTGYDHGLYKIWDCGQAKFVKRRDK